VNSKQLADKMISRAFTAPLYHGGHRLNSEFTLRRNMENTCEVGYWTSRTVEDERGCKYITITQSTIQTVHITLPDSLILHKIKVETV